MTTKMRIVDDVRATIGEGPVWSSFDRALYWIDTVNRRLMRLRAPFEASEVRDLPYRPSCLATIGPDTLLVVYKKGIGLFKFEPGEAVQFDISGVSFENEIFNDGACDALGRLWVGSRDRNVSDPLGSLYSFGPNLQGKCHASGFVVSNGIAFSPDGRTMYHTDSRPGRIDACDFDLTNGSIANRRIFIDYVGKAYHGDGCTVDADGGLWVAEINGGRIARYTPDGTLNRVIDVPLKKPTSIAFGGDDLSTMFVTSMRYGLSDDELSMMPGSGAIMIVEAGVTGLPEPAFRLA